MQKGSSRSRWDDRLPKREGSACFGTRLLAHVKGRSLDGIGISVLPTWAAAEPLRTGALKRILPGWELPASDIYAVYPGNRLMSMKVRAFVSHLACCFGKPPYWDADI